jgi:hypothetical protein
MVAEANCEVMFYDRDARGYLLLSLSLSLSLSLTSHDAVARRVAVSTIRARPFMRRMLTLHRVMPGVRAGLETLG